MGKFELIFLLLLFILMGSCWSPGKRQQLSRSESFRLDTVYASMEDSLKIEFDSLCQQKYDVLFSEAVDSIRAVRMEEIRR